MTSGERVKTESIRKAMDRAESGRYPIVDPTPEDNGRDLQWWLRVLDAKAFLISTNGSAAWLFPHYQLRLAPLGKRVIVEVGGETLVDSRNCFEFLETAHSPRIYIPRTEVDFRHLIETDTVTFCPFKGLAHYYRVQVRGREIADAFWTYDDVYSKFPDNGNASDVLKLKGMLSPDPRKLDVGVLDD